MQKTVKTAVFPVAGFGTRFLPATKAMPKEMLTVVDMPIIQYGVQEAIAAGVTKLIFVTGRGKDAIENHFDRAYELEKTLEEKGKTEILKAVQNVVPDNVKICYVRQGDAKGLGHAVHCAKPFVGNEPFAVILPDDIIYSEGKNALSEMIELYEQEGKSVTLTMEVPEDHCERYGIVDIKARNGRKVEANCFVEKPKENAPSNLACVGRYVFSPEIMDILDNAQPGAGGEIQLTDAMDVLLNQQGFNAWVLNGKRFDCGNKAGMQMANFFFAMKRDDIEPELTEFISELGFVKNSSTSENDPSSENVIASLDAVSSPEQRL